VTEEAARDYFEKLRWPNGAVCPHCGNANQDRIYKVTADPKKTSIHLVARSAFAGIATRKNELVLTIKSPADIQSSRIRKREQVSARRWHLEVRLSDPKQVDAEIERWIGQAFEISK